MNNLKFRIWDNDKKGFHYLDSIFNMPDPCYDGEVQQFIGLYDKNGKEIYEGDIVKWSNRIYIIKWYETIAGFIMERDDFELERPDIQFDLEVIGNKFEHTELLINKKKV